MSNSPPIPAKFMDLEKFPKEILKNILLQLRSDNGVIGPAAKNLIEALRSTNGPDGQVSQVYEDVITEVYATSLIPLMYYDPRVIPRHSNARGRFINLLVIYNSDRVTGVPQPLIPSPNIRYLRLVLYFPLRTNIIKLAVHTWVSSLGSLEKLELQTHGMYGRLWGADNNDMSSLILPRSATEEETYFALHEFHMCAIDEMLGVEGKRGDGFGGPRQKFNCVWELARGQSLASQGVNVAPVPGREVHYAILPAPQQ